MTFDLRITIGVAAAVLASGCQRQPERWTADRDTAICTDRSGRRVSDDQCSQHNRQRTGAGDRSRHGASAAGGHGEYNGRIHACL